MKKILLLILLVSISFASKWGETIIIGEDGTPAKVTDSSLQVAIVDSLYVKVVDTVKTTIYDESGRTPTIDQSTHTWIQIDYEHHEIHAGSHYQVCDYALNQSSGAIFDFVLVVPDSAKLPHMTFSISATDGATLEIYESPTGISGGTTITPVNNNWNSTNTSILTLTLNPTITADGTRRLGFIAGGNRTAGFFSRDRENMWERNTTYLFRITSLAVSNDIGYCASWYEYTDKE